MVWEKVTRWLLFGAGMLASVEAGHLFYYERLAPGGACLVMVGMFLYYALRDRRARVEAPPPDAVDNAAMTDLALFIADLAVGSLKGIGRTIPPSLKEISQMEDRLNGLLDRMDVPASRRTELKEEFDRIRGRARRNEGGLALIRSARL